MHTLFSRNSAHHLRVYQMSNQGIQWSLIVPSIWTLICTKQANRTTVKQLIYKNLKFNLKQYKHNISMAKGILHQSEALLLVLLLCQSDLEGQKYGVHDLPNVSSMFQFVSAMLRFQLLFVKDQSLYSQASIQLYINQ